MHVLSHASLVSSSTEEKMKLQTSVGIVSCSTLIKKNFWKHIKSQSTLIKILIVQWTLCLVNQIYQTIFYIVPDIQQACGLRNISKNQRFLTTKILSLYEKSNFYRVTQRQKSDDCWTWVLLEHSPVYTHTCRNHTIYMSW